MTRLCNPASKESIEKSIVRDYASTVYEKRGSQDFCNFMDRIIDTHMDVILKAVRERIIEMCYYFSRLFVDGSNMYTLMNETDMVRKGHNKKHRYELNQIS